MLFFPFPLKFLPKSNLRLLLFTVQGGIGAVEKN